MNRNDTKNNPQEILEARLTIKVLSYTARDQTAECWAAGWPEEAKGAMRVWGGLFKLIVGVRWMISAIVSCDPNKWWRCKVSLNICSLYLLYAIWDAVTASSLVRGCRTFLACHETTQQLSTGVTGTTYARFASIFSSSSCLHTITMITFTQSQSVKILHFTPLYIC